MINIALVYLGAYLIGALPFGVIIARMRGVDLLTFGSKNPGASNVARALGPWLGLLVFFLDIAKGAVPAYVAMQILDDPRHGLGAGVAAVLGHTLSPFLRFRGGKGIATSLGVLVGVAPFVALYGYGAFLVLFAISRIVSISSLIGALVVLISAVILRESTEFFVVFVPLVVYVFIRHRSNIKRLMKGEEPKLDLKPFGKKDNAERKREDDDLSGNQ
ncbi:MAG: glycerol-3-phosphate 1-O-acyltransferase PlsY [Armatimonadetes bacterium]|nr:glycerol-3-phosphate 1-O-acyltransferase PlsY [Armatimonadota bacterium]